jgi:DNA-binding SARP family transcriptional activator/class 3 adenylate cyclase/tetratricopeptide (TPR) repeat protein
MEFLVLGPLEVRGSARPLGPAGGRQAGLLALLALQANQVVATDRLIHALWGEQPPPSARQALQNHVSSLRKLLADSDGDAVLRTRDPGYVLAVEQERVDAFRFERLADAGRQALADGDPADAAALLRQALALWRGPALPELAEWAASWPELTALAERRLSVTEDRVEADLALGRHRELVGELDSLVGQHPLREQLRGQQMLALYRSGRQADALAAYRDARRVLVEGLGIEPTIGLQRLEQAILAQDPALDLLAPLRAGGARATEATAPPDADGARPGVERKLVTVLFCEVDLPGPPRRGGQQATADPEDFGRLLGEQLALVRDEVVDDGGTVEHVVGGTVMAVFGVPRTREDDPERAVRAALAIRDAIARRGDPSGRARMRAAVTTGEALVRLDERGSGGRVTGGLVTFCSRLQEAAPSGSVLVSGAVERATRRTISYGPASMLALDGRAEPVTVWSALEPRSSPGGLTLGAGAEVPLVGREQELEVLLDWCERARTLRVPQLVTLVGAAGIGKTRLLAEVASRLEAAGRTPVWRQGRSLPDGDGGTLSVLAEVVKAEAGILDTDSAERADRRLAQAVGAAFDRPGGAGATPGDGDEAAWVLEHLRRLVGLGGGADSRQRVSLHADRRGEVFAAWRRFLYRLAARQPLVLAIEDLHWADDALLDFLDGLTDPEALDRPGPAPLLVLATARPELAERRPDWGAGRRTAATLALAPLDEEETGQLLEALLARHGLATGVDAALVGRVGGNPLFAEEYVRLLRDQLAGTVAIPETVHAIIAARLDALPAGEKAVLQDVAVLGRAGWPGAVAAIGGYDRAWLDECLRALTAKEFVHRAGRSTVAGEREYRFRHVLVREVAYGQLPRAARAGRHRRAAAWLESLAEERLEDRAEMLASHYQWALRFGRAAGRVDPELTERARLALRAAGERAVGLGVFPTAARYYTEALALWPEDHPDRPRLRFRAAEARFYTQGTVGAQPPGLGGDAGGELRDARDELLAADDPGGAAEAEMLLAYLALDQGHPSEWKPHLRGALDLARKAPPSRSKAWALSHCAIHGLATGEVADALAAGREALAIARQLGLAELEATARSAVGALRVDQGDLGGVADLERARAALAKLNSPDLINSHFLLGFAHSRLGDLPATMAVMMAARATADRIGSVYLVRWMRFQGAAGEYWAGMWDEAVATADEFEAAAASLGHHYLGVVCHVSRAYIRLARGDGAGAVADAVAATQLAERWQDGHMPHIARTAHARTLLATGRTDEAAAVAETLLARFRPGPLPVPIGVDLAVVLASLGHPAAVLDRRGVTGSAWLDALRAYVDGDAAGAADVYARIGSRPDEAYARMEAGRRLLAAGAPGRARPQLTAALGFWRQVGAGAYAGEAEALLAIGAARLRAAAAGPAPG